MISYAQNFEDVMLARVFKNQPRGFYVDIGACHATRHSVTKHFYDLGWSGINVEALPSHFTRIQSARPRDININVAVGTNAGTVTFFEVRDTGLSTLRRDFAEEHAKQGFSVSELEVPTLRLSSVIDEHAGGQIIDFMKIDVEGAEFDVIKSGDWRRHRPRVLLVEATLPNSPITSFTDWEPLLLQNGFLFAYFDGLNRWYVREEESTLRSHFAAPPNVFDDFIPAKVHQLQAELDAVQRKLQSARIKADRLDALSKTAIGKLVIRFT